MENFTLVAPRIECWISTSFDRLTTLSVRELDLKSSWIILRIAERVSFWRDGEFKGWENSHESAQNVPSFFCHIFELVILFLRLFTRVDKLKIKYFSFSWQRQQQQPSGGCVWGWNEEIENVWVGKFMLMCFDVVVRDCTIWLWFLSEKRQRARGWREVMRKNFGIFFSLFPIQFQVSLEQTFLCVLKFFDDEKKTFLSCANSRLLAAVAVEFSLTRSSFYCLTAS